MSLQRGICARIGKGHGGHDHLPWISRDHLDVDCKAVGCQFNRGEKCMVPSRYKIGADGRCEGFQAPPNKTKVDGD